MKNLGSDAYSEFWRSIQGQQDSVARVMEEAMAASRRQADLIDANAYLLTERLRASSASFAEAWSCPDSVDSLRLSLIRPAVGL